MSCQLKVYLLLCCLFPALYTQASTEAAIELTLDCDEVNIEII
jgi:hypothetical protein